MFNPLKGGDAARLLSLRSQTNPRPTFTKITSLATSKIITKSNRLKLKTDDTGNLYQPDRKACGRLAQRDVKLLELFRKEEVEFDLLWIPTDRTGTLWLTIYGDKALAKDLGDALQEAEIYLQDPIHAERNTLYWNPHRFQMAEGLRTIDLKYNIPLDRYDPEVRNLKAIDVLKDFTSEDNLPETGGSACLRTHLKRYDFLQIRHICKKASLALTSFLRSHQMRGLTFMLRREQGWQLNTNKGDVWTVSTNEAGNTV